MCGTGAEHVQAVAVPGVNRFGQQPAHQWVTFRPWPE
jgi:hypothetical protein